MRCDVLGGYLKQELREKIQSNVILDKWKF